MIETNLVQYGSFDLEEAEREQSENDLASSGRDVLRLKAGKNVVRFLPPLPGKGYGPKKTSPFRSGRKHFVHPPGGGVVVFTCPWHEARKPCPACQKADLLRKTGSSADLEAAKDFFAQRRVMASVVDREDPERGPVAFEFGIGIHEDLIALRRDADCDFTDPSEKGVDIIITRTGEGKNNTEYKVIASRHASPLGNMAWIKNQPDLNVFFQALAPEDIRALFVKAKDGGDGMAHAKDVTPRSAAKREETAEDDAMSGKVDDSDIPF